jgi:hypothetical protein
MLLSLVIRLSNRFIKKRRLENKFTCRKIIQSSDHDKTYNKTTMLTTGVASNSSSAIFSTVLKKSSRPPCQSHGTGVQKQRASTEIRQKYGDFASRI